MSSSEILEPIEQTPLEQLGVSGVHDPLRDNIDMWTAQDSIGVLTHPSAKMSCRGVAGQIITPDHVRFSNSVEVIFPPQDQFINRTDYSLAAKIDPSDEFLAEITNGWDIRSMLVAPAISIKNGQPEPFAYMLPGKGIIYDRNEESYVDRVVSQHERAVAPHITWLSDGDILKALRHITLVIADSKRTSQNQG